jgi:hypothetical protein
MKNLLRSLYLRLPIIRELRSLDRGPDKTDARIAQLNQRLRLLETASIIQALEAVKAGDPRFTDSQRLLKYGAQYWSQNYEDGMIAEIFRRIQPKSKTFLEIGVEDGSETNTTLLLSQGWRGWWLDGSPNSCASIRSRLAEMPSLAARLTLREAFVSPKNIVELLRELGVPQEVDLFSLDIDLDTYHIWAALPAFKPRVVVVEYNAAIPPEQAWIHPWQPDRSWAYDQAFGASLKAFELLGRRYGYSLVGCDLLGVNAFFVRDDLVGNHFAAPFTAENHFVPPRYGLYYRWAHRSCFFGDTHSTDSH